MIENLGVGIDISNISNFKKIPFATKSGFYKEIFQQSEIDYCLKFKDSSSHFAGKFALKEAVKKSINDDIYISKIETFHVDSKPMIKLLDSEKNYVFSDIISISFFLIGVAILFTAVISFKKQKTTISPLNPEKTSSLVVSNIFKYSRNPMYLGMLFMLISLAIRYNIIGGIISISIFIFFITKSQIKPEELQMKKIFGEKYIH